MRARDGFAGDECQAAMVREICRDKKASGW